MARRRRRTIALSVPVLTLLAMAVACQDPTEVTLRITTGEACGEISRVGVVVGSTPVATQARFEQGYTSAESDRCDASGLVGTLVVTPGGDTGSALVAVGVSVGGAPPPDPTRCGDPAVSGACIIARRTFSFISGRPLTLPIHLDPLCVGRACDPSSTCFKGACVDATTVCNGSDCGLKAEIQGEGRANDAGSSDGAYDAEIDGGYGDDGAAADAMPDSDATTDGATGTYPLCGSSPQIHYCSGATGTLSPGPCDPGAPGDACCRCTCPSTGMTVSCTTSMAQNACSSLMPVCP